jgi:hypothetical protein
MSLRTSLRVKQSKAWNNEVIKTGIASANRHRNDNKRVMQHSLNRGNKS